MKTFIKAAVLAAVIMAGETAFGAQVSIGIRIGSAPPAPRVVRVVPVRPARDYVWVSGYWYPAARHYRWRDGYWVRPPFSGAVWIAPRYAEGHYFDGRWASPPRYVRHDNGKHGNGWGRGRGHRR
jgi:hypothetical protein